MGCDIHGRIEVRNHDHWYTACDLLPLVGRSYDAFGMLFGVRNNVAFDPAFPKRGFPEHISRGVEDAVERWGGMENLGAIEFHSASYATLYELQRLDWSEEAAGRDLRYTVLDEDKEPTGTKFGWSSGWADIINSNDEALADGEAVPNEDESKYIKRMKLTRRWSLSGAWEWVIFDLLELLGDRFGAENVRMVVWFDN